MATIEQISEILPVYQDALDRKCGEQRHYSDVIDPTDIDALETIAESSRPYDKIRLTPLEEVDPDYVTFLADHLRGSADARIDGLIERFGRQPSWIRRLDGDRQKATVLAFNEAPRDDENTKDGANGPPFFLAITGSGVEVVSTLTTLPHTLGLLAEFNGVKALFRVIEEAHPLLDGNEQFRSQFAGAFRNFPDQLEPIYQYESVGDLIVAKEKGKHREDIIAIDPRPGNVVYEDAFSNLLIRQKDGSTYRELAIGSSAILEVTHDGTEKEIPVVIGTGLKSAPLGKFVVYRNVDRDTQGSQARARSAAALLELIIRVDDKHPKQSRDTAGHVLRREFGGDEVDLRAATVVLKKDSSKPY